jgi:hypothetical protein
VNAPAAAATRPPRNALVTTADSVQVEDALISGI